jgi:hypothetical protein
MTRWIIIQREVGVRAVRTCVIASSLSALVLLGANAKVITMTSTQTGTFSDTGTSGADMGSGSIAIDPFESRFGNLLNTQITLNSTLTYNGHTEISRPGSGLAAQNLTFITYDLSTFNLSPLSESYTEFSLCEPRCSGFGSLPMMRITTSAATLSTSTSDPTAYGGDISYTIDRSILSTRLGRIVGTETIEGKAAVTRTYNPPLVNIYADAFIPAASVPNPLAIDLQLLPGGEFSSSSGSAVGVSFAPSGILSFAGDNRGFQQFGSYRVYQAITVDLNPNDPPVVSHQHDTGVTTAFRGLGNPPLTAKAPTTGLDETVFTNGAVTIFLSASAGNPFIPLSGFAAPISWFYFIDLSTNDGKTIDYHITGYTGFFPAFEIYIGCTLVTGEGTPYMGTTPSQLLLPAVHHVEAEGQISASDASGCDPP